MERLPRWGSSGREGCRQNPGIPVEEAVLLQGALVLPLGQGRARPCLRGCCARFSTGEECGRQRTQGNVAHLQKHQASQEDRPRQSAKTPAQVPAGHSPVSTRRSTAACVSPPQPSSDKGSVPTADHFLGESSLPERLLRFPLQNERHRNLSHLLCTRACRSSASPMRGRPSRATTRCIPWDGERVLGSVSPPLAHTPVAGP